jgi:hypothetical protein
MYPASRAYAEDYALRMGVLPTHTGEAKVRRQAANSRQRALQRD